MRVKLAMVKWIVPVILFFLHSSAMAQFEKGMRMPGVSVGLASFSSGKTEYSTASPTNGYTSHSNSSGFSLTPSLGWFISKSLVVGGRITGVYDHKKMLDKDNNITFRERIENSYSVLLGVFARKYFSEGNSFLPFAQLNVDAGSGSSRLEGFSYTTTYKETYEGKSSGDMTMLAGLSAGVTKRLGRNFGLDLSVGYTYSYFKNSYKTTSARDVDFDGDIDENTLSDVDTKTTNHRVQVSLGFQVFLDKHK